MIQALINDPDNTLFSITGFGADLALIRAEREKGRATAKKWREAMAKAETYTPLYIETYWELATVMHAVALARADIEQQLNHIAQADSQIHQALKGAKTQQQRDHLEEQHRGLFSRLTNLRAQRDELDRFEEDVVRSAAQDMTTIPLPSDSKLKRIQDKLRNLPSSAARFYDRAKQNVQNWGGSLTDTFNRQNINLRNLFSRAQPQSETTWWPQAKPKIANSDAPSPI